MIYEYKKDEFRYLVNDEFVAQAEVDGWASLFDVGYLQAEGLVERTAQGRGATYFFSWASRRFVLKHFYRGGLVRFLSKDWYLWTGAGKSRPEREFVLLGQMAEMGLPITRPVAARIRKKGLFYQADMITEELVGVRPLSGILRERALTIEEWERVGALIRRFHDRNVCHTDLNAHNVMISDEAMYLIDFDNGSIRTGDAWKMGNVERLQRSLLKLKGLHDQFYFSDEGWAALLKGYRLQRIED